MQSEKPLAQRLYLGTFDCFKMVWAQEGFTAYFKGAGANVLRAVGGALVLTLYDRALLLYSRRTEESR